MWWFHALTISTVVLQLVNFWILSQGKLKVSYILLLLIYTGLIGVESTLAMRNPVEQWSVGLYILVDAWAIAMATKGLLRLKKAEAARSSKNET